jgi:hypothetical protein
VFNCGSTTQAGESRGHFLSLVDIDVDEVVAPRFTFRCFEHVPGRGFLNAAEERDQLLVAVRRFFGDLVPDEVRQAIMQTEDVQTIARWRGAAETAATPEELPAALQSRPNTVSETAAW